jgi:hypothetical protein
MLPSARSTVECGVFGMMRLCRRQIVVLALVEPVDPRGEPGAPLLAQHQTDHEAGFDLPDDPAVELTEFVEIRDHALAHGAPDRGCDRDRVGRKFDGAAGEFAPLAALIPAARKRIASRNADAGSRNTPSFDDRDIARICCRLLRHGPTRYSDRGDDSEIQTAACGNHLKCEKNISGTI